jgi:8-amino-7-oxononanoate synthase
MLDFTSALYLGFRHPSRSLAPWSQFTTGKPSALEWASDADAITTALAELQGCERVTLLPSTLHLFFDLFEVLRQGGMRLYVDAGTYPIARWGAERAAARGATLRQIPHYDPVAAHRMVEEDSASRLRPVILADGFCPNCGRPAPLPQYLHCVAPDRGFVVMDDTQALGIWGQAPDRLNPYGRGGGGSLRLHRNRSPAAIVGSSLAKGFGVPLATLGGSAKLVRHFVRRSETQLHSSPPSIAALHAAEHALMLNATRGDTLRRHLARLVDRFRERIHRTRLSSTHSLFPVQTLTADPDLDVVRLHRMLGAAGVRTVAVRERTGSQAKLLFVFNASHSIDDVDRAAETLASAAASSLVRWRVYAKRRKDRWSEGRYGPFRQPSALSSRRCGSLDT